MAVIYYLILKINNLSNFKVDTDSIVAAIRALYPATINDIEQNKWYNYITLFGVRIDTCDTGQADDVIGCLWLNGLGIWTSLICAASTDPSPYYVNNPLADAKKAGGTAWVKEGQYLYYLSNFKGYPAFKPKSAVPVYRMPAGEGLDVNTATLGTSIDTFIHRSWGTVVFKKDSAGCNILKNTQDLDKIAQMAKEHNKKYPMCHNSFKYILLTRSQVESITSKPVIVPEVDIFNYLGNTTKFQLR